jgi:hypothetical protein
MAANTKYVRVMDELAPMLLDVDAVSVVFEIVAEPLLAEMIDEVGAVVLAETELLAVDVVEMDVLGLTVVALVVVACEV